MPLKKYRCETTCPACGEVFDVEADIKSDDSDDYKTDAATTETGGNDDAGDATDDQSTGSESDDDSDLTEEYDDNLTKKLSMKNSRQDILTAESCLGTRV